MAVPCGFRRANAIIYTELRMRYTSVYDMPAQGVTGLWAAE